MNKKRVMGCLPLVIVIGIIAWAIYEPIDRYEKGKQQMIYFSDTTFWRGPVKPSLDGYLLTEKLIPLRAIARRPNVPMFSNPEQGPVESFRQVMRPWTPYYVYRYDPVRGALRVAEKARLREEDALWVLETDVYGWTTRQVLNVEQPLPIYGSFEDAQADRNRLKEGFVFRYTDHFEHLAKRNTGRRLPMMAALPVLRQEEGRYWSFIRPDPEPQPDYDRPYEVCWIRWNREDSSTTVRLRITRPEFEGYINGLQKLLYDYRYGVPDEKSVAHREIYSGAQAVQTGEQRQDVGRFSNTELETRTPGIPHPSGILLSSIQSELQEENVKKRLLDALKMGNDGSLWDVTEIAYVEVDRMP